MSHRYVFGIIVIFLFSALQLTSCYNAPVSDEIRKKEIGSATTISIEMPEQASPGTYALSEIDENYVTFLDVLVFDEAGLFLYRASGYEIVNSPYDVRIKNFKADLRHTYNGDKVSMVILANARFLIGATTVGETKQDIMERINFKLPDTNKWLANSGSDFEPFPMWGQTPDFEFTVGMEAIPASVTLIPALARVDVGLNYSGTNPSGISGQLGTIYLSEVHVYNINKHGAVAPDPTYIAGTQVTQATVPNVANILHKGPIGYVYSTVDQYLLESKADIYLAESRFIEHGDTLCFVVGLWSNKFRSTNPNWNLPEEGVAQERVKTYYRIDAIVGASHRSILRHHRYRVNIRTVNALGAATIEQAYKSMAVNDPLYVPDGESIDPPLGVDLSITNDLKYITTFGDYFLSLDSHKDNPSALSADGLIELKSREEISAKFSTETNHDEGWKVKVAEKDASWLSIDGNASGVKNSLADFVVKAKAIIDGTYQREGVVVLTAGPDLRLTVKVRQTNTGGSVVPADTIDLQVFTIPTNYMGETNSSIQFYDHYRNNFNATWNWDLAANVRQGTVDNNTPPESTQQYPAYRNSCSASYKGGYRNWRLPTKIEAELMIKYAQNDLGDAYKGATLSATTDPESHYQALYISGTVESPSVQSLYKTTSGYGYQCVRDVDQNFYTTTGNPKILKSDKGAKDTLVFYVTQGLTLDYQAGDTEFANIISDVKITKEKDINHSLSKWIIETTTIDELSTFSEDRVTYINIKSAGDAYAKRVKLIQGVSEVVQKEYIIPNAYSKLGYDLEFASSDLKLTNWYLAANVPGGVNEIDTPPGGIQVDDQAGLNGSRPGSCADWGRGRGEGSGWRMPTGDELEMMYAFTNVSNRLGFLSYVYIGADIYNLATNVKGYQFQFGVSGLSSTERNVSVDKLVRRGTYADYSIRCVKVANDDFYTIPNSIKLGLYAETKVIFAYSKHGVDPVYAKGPNFDKIVSSISAPVASGGVKNDGFQLWEITVKFNDAILYDATATSLTIQTPGGAFSSQIIISQDGYGTAVSDEDMELPYKLEVTLDDYKDGIWYYASNVPLNYTSTNLPHKQMQFMGEHNTPDGSYMGSCTSLRMGGHSGWRLATIKELKALSNSGYFAAQSGSNKYYMSSETSLANTSQYRAMYNGDTTSHVQSKTVTSSSYNFLIRRCVRHLEFFEDPTISLYFGSAIETKSIFVSTKHDISTTNVGEGVGFSDVVSSYTINHVSTAPDNLQTWEIKIATKEVVNQARDQVTLILKSDDGSNLERAITIFKDGNYIVPSENILIATKNQIAKIGLLKPEYNNWYNYANVAQNNTSITAPPTPQLEPKDPYSCAALNFDGHDNWRLPTIKELSGIYQQFMRGGGIHMFGTNSQAYYLHFWSIESASSSSANVINFNNGTYTNESKIYGDGRTSYSYMARCVRDLDLFIGHDLIVKVGYHSLTKSVTVYSNYALPSVVTISDPQFAEVVSSVTTRHISTTAGVQKWEITITSKEATDFETKRATMDLISPDGGRIQRLMVMQEGRLYVKSANIVFSAEDQPLPYRTWYVYNNVGDSDNSINPTQVSPAREGSCAAYREGGYDDWRLPTWDELIKSRNFYSTAGIPLNELAFTTGYYMTSNTSGFYTSSSNYYVAYNITNGSIKNSDSKGSVGPARCVRSANFFTKGEYNVRFGANSRVKSLYIKTAHGLSATVGKDANYATVVDDFSMTLEGTKNGLETWKFTFTPKNTTSTDLVKTELTFTPSQPSGLGLDQVVTLHLDGRYIIENLNIVVADEDYESDFKTTWYGYSNTKENNNDAINTPPAPQIFPARERSCASRRDGGYSNWRMPKLSEIMGFVSHFQTKESDILEAFNIRQGYAYISGSTFINQNHIAETYIPATSGIGGSTGNLHKTTSYQYYVRCVRDIDYFGGGIGYGVRFGQYAETQRVVINLPAGESFASSHTPTGPNYSEIVSGVTLNKAVTNPDGSTVWYLDITSKQAAVADAKRATFLTLTSQINPSATKRVTISQDGRYRMASLGLDLAISDVYGTWYVVNNVPNNVNNFTEPPAPQQNPAREGSCAAYKEAAFGDWRVPTFTELKAIRDQLLLTTGLTAGLGFGDGYYWTSTTVPTSVGSAYQTHMTSVSNNNSGKSRVGYYTRCVRDLGFFYGKEKSLSFGHNSTTKTLHVYTDYAINTTPIKDSKFDDALESVTIEFVQNLPNGSQEWKITATSKDALDLVPITTELTLNDSDGQGLSQKVIITREPFFHAVNLGIDLASANLPSASWYVANNIADGVNNESFPPTPQVIPARAGSCAAHREDGFQDWRVPSFNELTELYNYYNTLSETEKAKLNFTTNHCWSSNTTVGSPNYSNARYITSSSAWTRTKDTQFDIRCIRDMLLFTGAKRTVKIGMYGDESVTTRVYSKRPLDNSSLVKGAGFDDMVASLTATSAGTTTDGLDIWDITITPKDQVTSGLKSTTATFSTTDASGITEVINIVQDARHIISRDGINIVLAPKDQQTGLNWYTYANVAQGNNKSDAISTEQLSPPSIVSCAGLSVAGYNNWRLPTVVELQKIYAEYTTGDLFAEMGLIKTNYWSSESYTTNIYAYYVELSNGASSYNAKTVPRPTRCVRDPNLFEAPFTLNVSVGAPQERRVLTLYSLRGLNTTFSTGGSYAAIVETAKVTHKETSASGVGRYELEIISKATTYQPLRTATITLTPTDASGRSQVVTITQDARFVLPSGVYVTKGDANNIDVTQTWYIAANTTDANNSSGTIPPLPQVAPARVGSCAGVTEGGIAGWRLPTMAELTAMRTHFMGIGTLADFGFQNSVYWSIESDANPAQAKYLQFYNGTLASSTKDSGLYTRCVRDPEFFNSGTTTVGLGFGSTGSTQTLRVYTNQGINATYTPGANFSNLIADVKIVKDVSMGSVSFSFWDIIVTSKDAKVFSTTPDVTTLTLRSADGTKTKVVNISINRKNIIKERGIYLASNDLVSEETFLTTGSWYAANNIANGYVSARDEEYPTAANQETPARKGSCAGQKDGYTNWRVPTIDEMLMIRHYVFANGGIAEYNMIQNYYWTSSSYSNAEGSRYYTINNDGYVASTAKTEAQYIRCVRDISFFQDIEASIHAKSNSYVRRFYVASDRAIASGFTEDLSAGLASLVSKVDATHVRTEGVIQYWYVDITTKTSTSSATPIEAGSITIKSEDGVKSQVIGIIRDNRLLMSESNIMMSNRDQLANTWYISANVPDANTSVEVPPLPQQSPAREGSCAALRDGGYSNWRVPSAAELGAMYTYFKGTGDWLDYWGIRSSFYGTIESSGPTYAYFRNFSTGESTTGHKAGSLVRCVRDLSWFEGATVKMKFNTERLTQSIEIPTSYGLSESDYDKDGNFASIVEAMSLNKVRTDAGVEYWQIMVTSKDAVVSGINQTIVTFYSEDRSKTQVMTITQDGRYFIADKGFIVAEKDAVRSDGNLMDSWYTLNNVNYDNRSTVYPPTPQISPELDGSCAASRTAGYANWRLPQIHELKAMHSYFNALGGYALWGFDRYYYWSGNSIDSKNASRLYFSDGLTQTVTKSTTSQMKGRCIRNVNWFEGHSVKMEFGATSSSKYIMISTMSEVVRFEKGASFDALISSVEFELLKKEGDIYYYEVNVVSKDAKRTAPTTTTIEFKSADSRTQTVTVTQDRLLIDEATGMIFAEAHLYNRNSVNWYRANNVVDGSLSMEEPPMPQVVPARDSSCAAYKSEGYTSWRVPGETELLNFHAKILASVGLANMGQYFEQYYSYWTSSSTRTAVAKQYSGMLTATPTESEKDKISTSSNSLRCARRHSIFNDYPVKVSIRTTEMTTVDISTREGIVSYQAGSNFSSLIESMSYERIGVMDNGVESWRIHFKSKPPTTASANMTAQLVLKGVNGGSQTVDVSYLKSDVTNDYYISASNLTVAKADILGQNWYVKANVAENNTSITFPPVPQISPARTGSCAAYVEEGLGGWRMPSQNELIAVLNHFYSLGGYPQYGISSSTHYQSGESSNATTLKSVYSSSSPSTSTGYKSTAYPTRCVKTGGSAIGFVEFYDTPRSISISYMGAEDGAVIVNFTTKLGANTAIVAGDKGANYDNIVASTTISLNSTASDGTQRYHVKIVPNNAMVSSIHTTTLKIRSTSGARSQFINITQNAIYLFPSGLMMAPENQPVAYWNASSNTSDGNNHNNTTYPPMPQHNPPLAGSCAASSEGGFTDWRMPSWSELKAIGTHVVSLGLNFNTDFNMPNGTYFSGETSSTTSPIGWYAFAISVNTTSYSEISEYKNRDRTLARCVRGPSVFDTGYTKTMEIGMAALAYASEVVVAGAIHPTDYIKGPGFDAMISKVVITKTKSYGTTMSLYRIELTAKPSYTGTINNTTITLYNQAKTKTQLISIKQDGRYLIPSSRVQIAKSDLPYQKSDGSHYNWYERANTPDNNSDESTPPSPQLKPAREGSCAAYSEGGITSWRIPTSDELRKIEAHFNSLGGIENFGLINGSGYWSIGTYLDDQFQGNRAYYWTMRNLGTGYISTNEKTSSFRVRCVKNI